MDTKKKIKVFPTISSMLSMCFFLFILFVCIFYLFSYFKTLKDFLALNTPIPVLGIGLCFVCAILLISVIALLLYSFGWYYLCYCRVVIVSSSGVQMGLRKTCFLSWDQISGFGIGKILPENKKAKQLFIYLYKGSLNHSTVARYGISDIWMMSHMKRPTDQGKPIRKTLLSRIEDLPISEITTMPEHIVWIRYSQDLYDIVSTQCQRGDGSG